MSQKKKIDLKRKEIYFDEKYLYLHPQLMRSGLVSCRLT